MSQITLTRRQLRVWQLAFILCNTAWLLAPALNSVLSSRTTLISQYETAGQPYAWVFRLFDFAGGLLLCWLVLGVIRRKKWNWPAALLFIVGAGMALDAVFVTNCSITATVCRESLAGWYALHAVESLVTALALLAASSFDAQKRQRVPSLTFVMFQLIYPGVLISGYMTTVQLNTLAQFIYQGVVVVWLAWYAADMVPKRRLRSQAAHWPQQVRRGMATWLMLNGVLAIVLSLKDIHLFGDFHDFYFARDTAWLAQHGVIIGVSVLYLSRHLWRGEQRARQLLLGILALEVLKYAVITPSVPLTLLYAVTFGVLFAMVDDFQRGTLPLTWRVRFKDLLYMLSALVVAGSLSWLVLNRSPRVSRIARRSVGNFSRYVVHKRRNHLAHHESALLAHTYVAFIAAVAASILWILFKPVHPEDEQSNSHEVRQLLEEHAGSSEDYFKLWPADKQYFWDKNHQGFIAYKVVGPVAFALADPIAPSRTTARRLIREFGSWAGQHRLKVCFLEVMQPSLGLYEGHESLQVGATALVNTKTFIESTSRDKWWRWKLNRAAKEGLAAETFRPPHSSELMQQFRAISDDWLSIGGHEEHTFGLGYFDEAYLNDCVVYGLRDEQGRLVAFANRLPTFHDQKVATIDLMRYAKDAADAMPFLLKAIIEGAHQAGFQTFDLGMVPFARPEGKVGAVIAAVGENFVSSKGLSQFKNKFDPEWQNMYLVYNGDVADLGAIATHVLAAMKLPR
jgi:lysylphosphatidylglycerol synthetase-like protein (DUF2156 family)